MNRREFLMSLLGGGAIIGAGARPPEIPDEDVYSVARTNPPRDLATPFRVVGLGGAGCNIIHNLAQSKRQDVQVIAINTDARTLEGTEADEKVLIGRTLMNGRGNLGDPELGRQAAYQDLEAIEPLLKGAGTVVIVAGLGGGTGTGAILPVVRLARGLGAFVPVVVTRPFDFEGDGRAFEANMAISALDQYANATVVIPNERLLLYAEKGVHVSDVFRVSDRMVLHAVKTFRNAVQGGASGISREDLEGLFPGTMGRTVIGTGSAKDAERGMWAAIQASYSDLLDRSSIRGARSVYAHVEGGDGMTLQDVRDAVATVTGYASTSALVRFGMSRDQALEDSIAVTVLATGFPGRSGATAQGLDNVRYWSEPWNEKT